MLTNTQTQPTQALAVPEPTAPAIVEQRPTTALGKWQRLDAMTQMKFADFLADAPIIPKPYRKQPGNVYVAAEMGAVLGWGPIEAMQNIDVIEGTPSLKAEAMRALIKAAGHRLTVPESSAESCTVLIERNDTLGDAQVTYTIEDGRRAGLAGKDVWKKHPARMLLARATTNAATIACPEVLRGMHFLDEGGGDPIEAGVPANPVEALQATTEAAAAIEAPEPAPEPAKKASKPAEAPQAAPEPEDAELVPDEPEQADEPTQATLDTADDNSDPLSADEWKQLLRERGLTLGDVAPAAKDILGLQSVNYSLLGKLEGESCARLIEALPAGNGAPFA
jgi:hypothetical protein